jgi:RNA polymerase primary sigma factor
MGEVFPAPFTYDGRGQGNGPFGGMTTKDTGDRARVTALRSGDPALVAQFLKDISATVWTGCCLLTGEEGHAREAFIEVMAVLRADNFARLGAFTGRGSLDAFVALTVRDLLAERMLRLFQSDREKGWRAFERFFESDILKLIRRHLPGPTNQDARRDAYQEICVALIDADYRRLKAFGGSGSFAGFVLRIVDRLLIDFVRRIAPRRRLPAGVARQSALDREVYRLVFWEHIPQRADILAVHLHTRLNSAPEIAEIAVALARAAARAPMGQEVMRLVPVEAEAGDLAAAESSPEEQLFDEEREEELAAALDVLERAILTLPASERLYLTIALGGAETPPSREIARLMQRPVGEIYKLKQRVLKHLRDLLAEESAVKNWRASV